jgi:hypothetical protein
LTLASRVAKETKPATLGYSPGEVWATHVATQFLTNKSSAIQSQEAASFSSAAGAAGVDTLAKIGNHGKAPKNCARDLTTPLHGLYSYHRAQAQQGCGGGAPGPSAT